DQPAVGQRMPPAFEHAPVRKHALGDISLVECACQFAYRSVDAFRLRAEISAPRQKTYEVLKDERSRQNGAGQIKKFLKLSIPANETVASVEHRDALHGAVQHRSQDRGAADTGKLGATTFRRLDRH